MSCLPVSNCDAERVFSQVSLIKTDTRNRFLTENVSKIIQVKESIKNCLGFEPTASMLSEAHKNDKY